MGISFWLNEHETQELLEARIPSVSWPNEFDRVVVLQKAAPFVACASSGATGALSIAIDRDSA